MYGNIFLRTSALGHQLTSSLAPSTGGFARYCGQSFRFPRYRQRRTTTIADRSCLTHYPENYCSRPELVRQIQSVGKAPTASIPLSLSSQTSVDIGYSAALNSLTTDAPTRPSSSASDLLIRKTNPRDGATA